MTGRESSRNILWRRNKKVVNSFHILWHSVRGICSHNSLPRGLKLTFFSYYNYVNSILYVSLCNNTKTVPRFEANKV